MEKLKKYILLLFFFFLGGGGGGRLQITPSFNRKPFCKKEQTGNVYSFFSKLFATETPAGLFLSRRNTVFHTLWCEVPGKYATGTKYAQK